MRTSIKTIVLFLVMVFLMVPSFQIHGASQDLLNSKFTDKYAPKTVRVGMPDSDYFSKKQKDGSYEGIVIDYLEEISKYAGWKLEYVEGSIDRLTKMLKSGEIDVMGTMIKNAATIDNFDFADSASGYSYTMLYVQQDNNQYHPMDYESFDGMRVGIFSKAFNRVEAFNAFKEANDIDFKPVFYDDNKKYEKALENHEVDAMVGNDTSDVEGCKAIAKFGAIPYYFAVTKGNSALLRELNDSISNIFNINPNFDDMLYDKHIGNKNNGLSITKSEVDFVENMETIRVASIANLAPYEYYDKSTDKIEGISPDILALIAKKTGLKFAYTPVNTLEDAKQMLLSGKVDMITGLYDNDTKIDGMDIVFTRRVWDSQLIAVKNSAPRENAKGKIAMPMGYSCAEIVPFSDIIYYETMEDCIEAVVAGETEFTAFNSLVIDNYTYLRGNRRISLTPVTTTADGMSFGFARPADPMLLTIMDKAIYSISMEELQKIVYRNTADKSVPSSFLTFVYTYPLMVSMILIGLGAILLIIVTVVLMFMRTRLKLAQQTAIGGETHRIIGELTGEYLFTFDFDSQELLLPKDFTQLIGCENKINLKSLKDRNDDSIKGNLEPIKSLLSTFDAGVEGTGKTVEFQCKHLNGDISWYRAVGTVQYNLEKKPIRGIGRIVSIQEEKQEMQLLESKANTDALTGLYSRQFCEEQIINYFLKTKDNVQGALFVMDLDYFKQINDSLGHLAGDKVLKEFADVLTHEFRADDIVGRWGGDEFIAFIYNAPDVKMISDRASHLCKIMHKEFTYEGKSKMLSISVGIALTKNASTYQQVFQNADDALYEVKNNSRNGFLIK